ncbi:MAG: sel1 repeat family protein [Synergistaceae bacterium]|nr:sel1 repeat family protein [Synergistaceae bacterium]
MEKYDPLLTMSALNMAVVSLHRIKSAKDRVTLDSEYRNIINNLRMGEINADPELTSLYQEIVRIIHKGRLRDELRNEIEAVYSHQQKKSIKEIISGNFASSFSTTPLKWLARMAMSCVSEYFMSKAKAELTHDRGQLNLRKDELDEYDELQRKLFDSSWKLLRMYKIPDSYRLTQNALDKFYAAVQENDPSKRMRMLKYIEGEFAMYSPYWFCRARSAQDAGSRDEAVRCFAKFGEVWRPVLRKDPYRVEALKFRVDELAQEGISGKNAGEVLECLAGIRENAELEDWANNIYLGMMYFTLGDKEKAVESVMCNIDFGFETKNIRKVLAKFKLKTPPKKFTAAPAKSPEAPKPEPVRTVREEADVPPTPEPEPKPVKQSLKVRAESGDAEAQYELGASYDKRKDTTALGQIVICAWLCVGWLVWHYLLPSSFIWCLLWIVFVCWIAFALGVTIIDGMPENYYEPRAIKWFTKAAENGHVEAMYRLAEIYCAENPEHYEAERWYKNAAVRGHIPSQKALSAMYKLYGDDYPAYMWAYLAYLCGGTENLGNKPYPGDYPISLADARKAEDEARRMFDDIQHNKGGAQ